MKITILQLCYYILQRHFRVNYHNTLLEAFTYPQGAECLLSQVNRVLVPFTRTSKYYSEKSFYGASVIAVDALLLAPLDRADTAQASWSVRRHPRKLTFTSRLYYWRRQECIIDEVITRCDALSTCVAHERTGKRQKSRHRQAWRKLNYIRCRCKACYHAAETTAAWWNAP